MFARLSSFSSAFVKASCSRLFCDATARIFRSLQFALILAAACFGFSATAAAQNPSTTVNVDANTVRQQINPNIYGAAYFGQPDDTGSGTSADIRLFNLPTNRIGGNNDSEYNWNLQANAPSGLTVPPGDAINKDSDYYWESYYLTNKPNGFRDSIISTTNQAGVGTETIVTIPMLSWIAKVAPNATLNGGPSLWSYSVKKYGPQVADPCGYLQGSDGGSPGADAGSGIKSTGPNCTYTFITGNDPTDAYMPNSVAIQKAYVQYLVNKYGDSQHGGIKYYQLDNEPFSWSLTHRDIHPNPDTYDEMWSDIQAYAGAIKSVDPNAIVIGPEEPNWYAMWVSGHDNANGLGAGSDYATHGNMYYYPWLLSQLAAYKKTNGINLVDVLSAHCYTDDYGSVPSAVNTRELWDPSFKDPNWYTAGGLNGSVIEWIPLMQQWIQQYDPGIETGCTEYTDWDDDNTLSGIDTQADMLGIFGYYGLDFANTYTAPTDTDQNGNPQRTPSYLAFMIYRNYDGKQSTFGDQSVSTTVANPDNLSAFAALRSSDSAMTVMVVNKQTSSTSVTVSLGNFSVPTGSTAQVYQISNTTQTSINSLTSIPVTGNSLSTTVPAQSVTLFVVDGTVHVMPPAAPTNLTATVGDQTVTLNWTASPGATSYIVYRSTSATGPFTEIGTTTTTTFTDTGLTNGTTYYYTVAGVNSAGTGPQATPVAATPIAPPTFTATATANPVAVAEGTATTLTATVTDQTNSLAGGAVAILAVGPDGNSSVVHTFSNQNFSAGQSQTYNNISFTPSLVGTYTIEVEVLSASGQVWYLNNNAATVVSSQPGPPGCNPGMDVAYFTMGETDADVNLSTSTDSFGADMVRNQLGENGLPVFNSNVVNETPPSTFVPHDLLSDNEITWWSASLNNGGPGNTSDVVQNASEVASYPYTNVDFYPPNGRGPGDGNGFQTAIFTATMKVPTAETINYFVDDDDWGTVYVDGALVCDNAGPHSDLGVSCSVPATAGNHVLKVYYADLATSAAVLQFSLGPSNVCVTPLEAQTITWPTPAPIDYGTALSSTQLDAVATTGGSPLSGTYTYQPPAGTVLPAGTQQLTVVFTPTDTIDYKTETANVQLTINPISTAIKWPPPTPISSSTPLGADLDASLVIAGTTTVLAANCSYTLSSGTPISSATVLSAGIYTLEVTCTPDDSNYSIATGSVTLTVTLSTTATINWPAPAAITYGTPLSSTQLDAMFSVPGTCVYTPAAGTVLPVGSQTLSVTCTPTDTVDFTTATATKTLTVTKAALTVTANNASMPLGGPLPTLSGTLGGVVNGDNITASYATTATANSPVGQYPITATLNDPGSRLVNYTVTNTPGTLTVRSTAPMIAWAQPAAITYGTPLGATQLDASAASGGSAVTGTFVYSPAAGTVLTAGTHTLNVTFTPTDTADFSTAMGSTTIMVNQATPTITWATPSSIAPGIALGSTQLDATASFNGSAVAGTFSYSPAAGTVLTSGTHTLNVTFTPTDSTDFTTATASVTISVAQNAPTITWPTPAAITYGTALGATQLDATAASNGTPVPGTFAYTPAAGIVLTAGTHTLSVTFTPTDTTDFSTAQGSTTIVVNRATPTINWPTPSAIASGTALGSTQLDATASFNGSAVAGTFAYSPAAGTVLSAGMHTLNVTFTPTDSTDFAMATASVTINVVQNAPTITWPAPSAITYGTALSATQLDATATFNGTPIPGTFAYTPAAGTVLTAGAHTLSVTFTPTDPIGFSSATATTMLVVNQAMPVLTWQTPAAIDSSTPLSATQLDATASVPGTFVYLPAAGTLLSGGTQTLSVTFTPTDTTNYATATATVTITVLASNFTISATPGGQSVSLGSSTNFNVTVTPVNGPFNNMVSLSVAGLPPPITATFDQPSIMPGASAASTGLKISVDPNFASKQRPTSLFGGASRALASLMAILLLMPLRNVRKAARKLTLLLVLAVSLNAMLSLSACNKPLTTFAQRDYVLTVTGTGGGSTRTTQIVLTVK